MGLCELLYLIPEMLHSLAATNFLDITRKSCPNQVLLLLHVFRVVDIGLRDLGGIVHFRGNSGTPFHFNSGDPTKEEENDRTSPSR